MLGTDGARPVEGHTEQVAERRELRGVPVVGSMPTRPLIISTWGSLCGLTGCSMCC